MRHPFHSTSGLPVNHFHSPVSLPDRSLDRTSQTTGAVNPRFRLNHASSSATPRRLVFVDGGIESSRSLSSGVLRGSRVVVLDSRRNGVQQISAVLAQHRNLSNIHIVSNGRSGALELGNTVLHSRNLVQYRSALQNWRQSLAQGAEIFLYGCNVAQGQQGRAFVRRLGQLTGRAIAASTDLTGNAARGGDWDLEFNTGRIRSGLAFSTQAMRAYRGVLDMGTGLRADYYDNIDLTNLQFSRTDATVNFDWGGGSPSPAMAPDTFSVRWTGKVQPRYSETYTFYTGADDGTRLWVNNQLVIDNWRDQPAIERSGTITLQAGQLYDLRLEYYERGGQAASRLLWSSPTQTKEVIPQSRLYLPDAVDLPPTASLIAGDAPTVGAATHRFNVLYGDDTGINAATLDSNDLVVTGPNGFSQTATLVSIDAPGNGTPRTATYSIAAPGATWDSADNGDYTVTLQANQVMDTGGNAIAAGSLGSFQVNLAPPPPAGSGNGLRAEYYDNLDFTGPVVVRTDASINFEWGNAAPMASMGADTFSVRWSGQIEPRYSDTYTFQTTTDDGVRLWVNDQLLINQWRNQAATNWTGSIALQAGQRYNIRMEYFENGGGASAALGWSSQRQSWEIIPQSQLFSDTAPVAMAPTASLQASGLTTAGTDPYRFSVIYSDDSGINVATLDSADLLVTGPNGFSQTATFVGTDLSSNGTPRTATYSITAPDGTWDSADNGDYTVSLQANQVTDIDGVAVAAGTLGNVQVNIAPPPPVGSGTGLRAEYYDNMDLTGPLVVRTDANINFEWGNGAPMSSMGADTFSVRWLGQISPRYSETYTFQTTTDDGVRLWVNDQLLIDRWQNQPAINWTGSIALEAGQRYDLRMEYFENGGGAMAALSWSSQSQPLEIVPQSQLFSDTVPVVPPPAPGPSRIAPTVSSLTVSETSGRAIITLERTGDTSTPASVAYNTVAGTATAGLDFTPVSGRIEFAPGVTTRTVEIPILQDNLSEGDETFIFTPDNAIGADLGVPRTVAISITDNTVTETGTSPAAFDFANFADVSSLRLNGDAQQVGQVLRLTSDRGWMLGSAFLRNAIAIDGNTSFQTQFQFRIGGTQGTAGADGFTFVLQNNLVGAALLGNGGGSLGYEGTGRNSLAIEFDTFNNGGNDINDNHISLLQDGNIVTPLATVAAPMDLNSGEAINAWVDYDGINDRLQVFLSNSSTKPLTPVLSQNIDLVAALGTSMFLGFTGATGGMHNTYDIEHWRYSNTLQAPPPDGFLFSQPNVSIGEAGTSVAIAVERRGDLSGAASVVVETVDGTAHAGLDYTAVLQTLQFAPGQAVQTLSVPILNDALVEGDESFTLRLRDAVGGELSIPTSMTVSIADNDAGNFVRETVLSGLRMPTAIEWTMGGNRMLIAEKGGVVKVHDNGVLLPTPFIDISQQVNEARDRGLLGLAIHPNFPAEPYVYLLFTYDPPEVYNPENVNNPNNYAGPDEQGNRPSRLIRVTADPATNFRTAIPGSEVILLGTNSNWQYTSRPDGNSTADFTIPASGIHNGTTLNIPANLREGNTNNLRDYLASDSESHTIGSVRFGTDGMLFVSNGDGTSYNRMDDRTIRVQDLDNLSGKMLRIDPMTGQGLSSNPFYNGDADSNRSKVYSYGLRNPFRFAVNRTTNEPFIGDVGWFSWEEVNTGRGRNFGWPYYEGPNPTAGGYADLPQAQAFYVSHQSYEAPLIARSHASGFSAIAVGDFYTGTTFPDAYQGALFFNDIVNGNISTAFFNPDGTLSNIQPFATGLPYIVQMATGPDSNLYYVNLAFGEIGRWRLA